MIVFICVAIAVLGAFMLLVMVQRIRELDQQAKLDKHRDKSMALPDLLNYAAEVDDGVIVCKNGAFMAAWMYEGSDNASATDVERNIIAARINNALSGLGNGWMAHIDVVRRHSPNYSDAQHSHFQDPVTAAIDEERRRTFEDFGRMYEGVFVLTVTFLPPVIAEAKFVELMFDDDSTTPDQKKRTAGLIEKFKRDVVTIENGLSSAVKLTRLRGVSEVDADGHQHVYDEFLRYLQYCVTGKNHPVQLPSVPMYLDALVGAEEMWSGTIGRVGRKFIQVVAIDGFPSESHPGILSRLAELPIEYRWSSRFIFMDDHTAEAHLEKYRKKWRQKVRGFFDQVFNTSRGTVDQDAMHMVADAEAAIAEVKSGVVSAGYYTSVIVLMDEDRRQVEESARFIEKAINELGFAARVETINTMDAFFGSLPGHGVENVRRPLINSLNLAHLMPTSTIWTGSVVAPCPFYPPLSPALMHCVTNGSSPFRLNLHVRDVGHTLVFGPTGAGKSTLLGMIAAQARRYQGMSIFSFDKGMSMYAVCKGAGGQHYSVAADDSSLAFCPLQYLETRADRAWAMEWIDTILRLNDVATTPAQRNEIGSAIMSMHENGSKTLTDFVSSIQDHTIRDTLKPYTIDGAMGHLLDATEDGLALSDFTVFEIEELMNLGDKFALPVLLYLFRRIEAALHGQPAILFLDEAWLMLGHPAFRQKIKEWLKVLRKANCLVLMATQSLTDAANSGILDVLVESTATKIFLPNIYARDEDTAALYKRMGLNSRQIEIIASATPKRHYYYVSEQGRRLFDLALGPVALAFVAASDKESVAEIKDLESKLGGGWTKAWAQKKGISEKIDFEVAA